MCGYDDSSPNIDRYEDELCPRCDSPSYCYVHSRRYDKYRNLWEDETIVLAVIDFALLEILWRMDVRQAREKLRSLYSDRLIRAMEPEQRINHIKNEMWDFIENGLIDTPSTGHGIIGHPRNPWISVIERRKIYKRMIGRDGFLHQASPKQWSQGISEDRYASNIVICHNWHRSDYRIYFDDDWDGCKECAKEYEEYCSDPVGWKERWEERVYGERADDSEEENSERQNLMRDFAFSVACPTDHRKHDFDTDSARDIGYPFTLTDYRV